MKAIIAFAVFLPGSAFAADAETADTPEDIAIRFASGDVAVATVTSTMSPYTGPDGVKQGPQKQVRTFIVVKRGERWLIMQDHNTTVAAPPA